MTVTIVKNSTFAKAMFIYGCLTTLPALYIYISFAILERPEVPEFVMNVGSLEIWLGVVFLHLSTFAVTFTGDYQGEWDPLWKPVIPPKKTAILIGRVILLAVTCNVVYWIPYFYVTLDPWAPWRFVAAMLLLSTTYTAAHWALRPENIFSWKILRFFANPFDFLTDPLLKPIVERRIASRPAMPFDQWVPELLRSCELAADSSVLVNSEEPQGGEIDCLNFQELLFDELASDTCVLRYKKRLSRQGVQSIREFLHTVAQLDARKPDQAQWREAVHRARAVLSLREKLTR